MIQEGMVDGELAQAKSDKILRDWSELNIHYSHRSFGTEFIRAYSMSSTSCLAVCAQMLRTLLLSVEASVCPRVQRMTVLRRRLLLSLDAAFARRLLMH